MNMSESPSVALRMFFIFFHSSSRGQVDVMNNVEKLCFILGKVGFTGVDIIFFYYFGLEIKTVGTC